MQEEKTKFFLKKINTDIFKNGLQNEKKQSYGMIFFSSIGKILIIFLNVLGVAKITKKCFKKYFYKF